MQRPFSEGYVPTAGEAFAAAPIEHRGIVRHLVLWEVSTGAEQSDILDNAVRMAKVDAVAYVYDASDARSFAHILALRARYALLSSVPGILVAAKTDAEAAVQQNGRTPQDVCAAEMALAVPVTCSAALGDTADVFSAAMDAAIGISLASTPALSERSAAPPSGHRLLWGIAFAAAAAAVGAALWLRSSRH